MKNQGALIECDKKLVATIDKVKEAFGLKTRAEVVTKGIHLLNAFILAEKEGLHFYLDKGKTRRRIVIG